MIIVNFTLGYSIIKTAIPLLTQAAQIQITVRQHTRSGAQIKRVLEKASKYKKVKI